MKRILLSISLFSFAVVWINASMTKDDYQRLNNKSGESILETLNSIIYDHTDVGYDGLYDVYKTSDSRSDGSVWDMYSDCKFTHINDKCGSYDRVCKCYNREHSVPQSWFSGQHMKSDAFHVYPTDGYVNNQRGNFPFGECSNGSYLDSKARGKLGTSTFNGYSGKVFEPVDEYKGDFARSYFYMVACYYKNNMSASEGDAIFTYSGGHSGFTSYGVNLLMRWHRLDPVSEKEIVRNDAVFAHQHNRNPFIDYPCLAEYIWGDKKGEKIDFQTLAECASVDPGPGPGPGPGPNVDPVFDILPVTDVHSTSVVLHWTDANVTDYIVDVYQKEEGDGEQPVRILLDEFDGESSGTLVPYASFTDLSGNIRLGSGSSTGGVEYDGLDLSHDGYVRVKAKSYGSDNEPTFTVKVGSASQQFTAGSDYKDYIFEFEGSDATSVSIMTDASKKRIYIDEVEIVAGSTGEQRMQVEGYPRSVGNVLEHRVTGLEPNELYYFTVQPDGMPVSPENIIFTEEGWQGFNFVPFPTLECLPSYDGIELQGLEDGSLVQVFAANGILISSFYCNGQQATVILHDGLYLVNVMKNDRQQCFKVIVR